MSADLPGLLVLAPPDVADLVERVSRACGLHPARTTRLSHALARLRDTSFAGTVLSLAVDDVDEAVVARVAAEPHTGVLLLVAPSVSLETALLMERVGAVAVLGEPLDADELGQRLAGIVEEGGVVAVAPHPPAGAEEDAAPVVVGGSRQIGAVLEMVAKVARSTSTVLVTGESGTGKEVVARALHWASDRRSGPFVAVNCAAIPEHLLESELFGHERGAFTGAVARRTGRFERANGGTLFLDEIGDMSLVLQAKVLRALEERTIEPVGGESGRAVDVRVVAATNQELGSAMREGRFREDLYYRLAVVELELPPLRERSSDIRPLALHFAAAYAERHGRPIRAITEAALHRLESAPWPGNVRELRNVMDRAVLLASGPVVRSADLRIGSAAQAEAGVSGAAHGGGYPPTLSLEAVEADHIRRVLAAEGQIGSAADTLGIHRNTLTRKMKRYGIHAPEDGATP